MGCIRYVALNVKNTCSRTKKLCTSKEHSKKSDGEVDALVIKTEEFEDALTELLPNDNTP